MPFVTGWPRLVTPKIRPDPKLFTLRRADGKMAPFTMRVFFLSVLFVLAASLVSAHVLPRPDRPRPSVCVRVVPEAGAHVDGAILSQAIRWSHDIWRPFADVCFGTDRDVEPATAMTTLTVSLTERIVTEGVDDSSSLGGIEFVDDRPSTTLTVSVGAARQLVSATKWQGRAVSTYPPFVANQLMARALGRAIAHEVGHYLLASKRHTRHGLMRAQFSGAELVRGDHALDSLEADQIARLRGRFTERAEAVPPAPARRPIG
jgi:hypothetical protein